MLEKENFVSSSDRIVQHNHNSVQTMRQEGKQVPCEDFNVNERLEQQTLAALLL
jgi:hypothetical protein